MKSLALCAIVGITLGPAAASSVSTLVGTGVAGYTDTQVANPYGMIIGPDGAMYFCDLDNSMIRRLDLKTKKMTLVAGNGRKGYSGDGGPATEASLAAPHELVFDKKGDLFVAERDNHVIRKIDMKTGIITTAAGNGMPGFGGDGGPGTKALLRQPHSIIRDRDGSLLICDIGNHRIRRFHTDTGIIETWAGNGMQALTPEGAVASPETPLNGPRTMIIAPNGDIFLALREGNSIYRIDGRNKRLHRIAGTGENGYSGDGGPALQAKFGGAARGFAARLAGPKGLAYSKDTLYVVDTDSHAIRKIDLKTNIITTILGTGEAGDGPETDPLKCKLSRPHAALFYKGALYVTDSEAHRIRVWKP
jgi:DNA-binding beta-propeller fold protein YncE